MHSRRAIDEAKKGSAEVVILAIVEREAQHGYQISKLIELRTGGSLTFTLASLYATLYRLEDRGWIASFWGTSENNRKAKYYRLTPAGRKQLASQTARWEQVVRAIGRILNPATE